MGTCNCTERASDTAQVTVGDQLTIKTKPQAGVESSAVEVQNLASFEPSYTLGDIKYLQGAASGYLERKRIRSLEVNRLEFADSPDTEADQGVDHVIGDVGGLLTPEAKATLDRLPELKLERDVKNVVNGGIKRLTKTGSIYLGQWAIRADGLPVRKGKGKLFTSDKGLFEGYWKDGKLHLQGRIIYPNGDYYEGQFENGLRSGTGKFETYHKNSWYTGSWKEDGKHGSGYEQFEDGSRYEGDFVNDQKTGKGKFVWSDGSSYTGDFLNGQLTGHGDYRWKDGRTYIGEWKDGKMNGQGKFMYADGIKVYEGQYVNDKKEGTGVYKWEDGVYDGPWLKGKMHGIGNLTNSKGVKKRVEFNNGVKVKEVPE